LQSFAKVCCSRTDQVYIYYIHLHILQNLSTAIFSHRLNEGTQDNKPVLTISHAEHVRLIAVVNEEHKLEPPQKRKRKCTFKNFCIFMKSIFIFFKESESNNDELLNPSHTLTVKDETSKTKREKKAPRNDDVMVN